MNDTRRLVLPAATVLASLMLVACDNAPDDRQATANEPSVVAQSDSRSAPPNNVTVQPSGERAADATRQAGRDAMDATRNATADAGDKVTDAVITTSVNAELAKDDTLKATDIDVDTADGRVSLKGTAPSEQAKERATQLAQAVKGVTGVDNQLRIEPAKS